MRDPKHLGFTLARYKFVAKMLSGLTNVCEVGCHEATGTLSVAKEVGWVTALDIQPEVIDFCREEYGPHNLNINFDCIDVLDGLPKPLDPDAHGFDAISLFDVLEHVDPVQENDFMASMVAGINPETGVMIVGIPSLESQKYASPVSAAQHINCKTQNQLKDFLSQYFANVFMFGMNDEVLHTGFPSMCQYILCIAVGPKGNQA